MKIQYTISECNVSENTVLDRVEEDWGIRRPNRSTKTTFSFYDSSNLKYSMAVITSPKEYAGKIVGYSGVGEYGDLLVDGGTFVIGGAFAERHNLPDFRGNEVGFKVRNVRDNYSETLSDSRKIPFCIIVLAGPNGYTRHLESKGYEVKSEGLPQWAIDRCGSKYYVVYNPIIKVNKAMEKAWTIIKAKAGPQKLAFALRYGLTNEWQSTEQVMFRMKETGKRTAGDFTKNTAVAVFKKLVRQGKAEMKDSSYVRTSDGKRNHDYEWKLME